MRLLKLLIPFTSVVGYDNHEDYSLTPTSWSCGNPHLAELTLGGPVPLSVLGFSPSKLLVFLLQPEQTTLVEGVTGTPPPPPPPGIVPSTACLNFHAFLPPSPSPPPASSPLSSSLPHCHHLLHDHRHRHHHYHDITTTTTVIIVVFIIMTTVIITITVGIWVILPRGIKQWTIWTLFPALPVYQWGWPWVSHCTFPNVFP